jgi:hypothetical protein
MERGAARTAWVSGTQTESTSIEFNRV